MLRPGFLGALATWVADVYAAHPSALREAQSAFGFDELLQQGADPEGLSMLFSEWLVFDHATPPFTHHAGIEQFITENPLHLPERELKSYRDLSQSTRGIFEVVGIEHGRGVTLREFTEAADEHFVHDVHTSLSVKPGEIMWGRIAPVDGVWHLVGSTALTLAVGLGPQLRAEMRTWDQSELDARWAAHWRYGARAPRTHSAQANVTYKEAKAAFAAARARCGMQDMFTLSRFVAWVKNEEKYGKDLPLKALMYLIPETVDPRDSEKLIEAGEKFMNVIPRPVLGGRTPHEASAEAGTQGRHAPDLEFYAQDTYAPDLERAFALMRTGPPEAALESFEALVERLLDDATPFVTAFRIYANAGVVSFERGDPGLGAELLDASLRLNPHYEFAARQRDRYLPYYDPTYGSAEEATQTSGEAYVAHTAQDELGEDHLDSWPVVRYLGKLDYKRSVFREYESFLKRIGVSLTCHANAPPTMFSRITGEEVGRNDPCPCSSGKKYKRCCGR